MKAIKLIIVWLWVIIPLAWGVMKSVQKAMPLFTGVGPAAPSSPKQSALGK